MALRAFQWSEAVDNSVYFAEKTAGTCRKKRDIHEDVSCGKEASLIRAC